MAKGTTWRVFEANRAIRRKHHSASWISNEQTVQEKDHMNVLPVCSALLPAHRVAKWAAVWLWLTQVGKRMRKKSLNRVSNVITFSPDNKICFPAVDVAAPPFFFLFLGAINKPFSQRADRMRPTWGTGFRCLQIIHWPWLNAGTTGVVKGRGGVWCRSPQISLDQKKSINEPEKKAFYN